MKVAPLLITKSLFIIGSLLLIGITSYIFVSSNFRPIKIGILHSLTGNLSFSEKPVVDAELMAIDEINASGGVLGRKLIPIVADGKSDDATFAKEAERLIKEEKVAAIIGCWTSSSRKAITPIIQKNNNLLIYPVSFEGMEDSPYIMCTGATQNQQIIPAALWSFYNLGKRFFLVGSESIFSRLTTQILKDTLESVDAEILGEHFLLVGSQEVGPMLDAILKAKPDVILNSLHGITNLAFFKELRKRGITPEKIPVMTISSVSEVEFAHIGSDAMAGDYVTASYFQSIEREENTIFVTNFKKKYGKDRVISESEEAGYYSVYLWAQTAQIAQTSRACHVRKYLNDRALNAPEGIIYSDFKYLNMWKMTYVGKLRSDGQFTIVWNSQKAIQPILFPIFKSPQEWKDLERDFYEQWGKQWTKVGPSKN